MQAQSSLKYAGAALRDSSLTYITLVNAQWREGCGSLSPQQGRSLKENLMEETEDTLCKGTGQGTKVGIWDAVNGKVPKANLENET